MSDGIQGSGIGTVYVLRCRCYGIVATFKSDPAHLVRPAFFMSAERVAKVQKARWCTDPTHGVRS